MIASATTVAVFVQVSVSSADEVPRGDNGIFVERVAPILAEHCSECHNEDEAEFDLVLNGKDDVLRGSRTGPVVTPGKASASLLWQVLAKDADPHMPPEEQLPSEQIAVIGAWIDSLDQQTTVGKRKISEADRQHWSFQPVERPSLPEVKDTSWSRSGIDPFVLARLEAAQLSPSPPADKAVLLRRVYFDLIGLPPSPEEVQAFLENDSEDAYSRIVDRLLASARYGERWGRHWLDLARYADTGGFHNDIDRPFAWRYRDYVIESLNEDKPYAQFIREQIAGDELPDATLETWTATGFCRHGASNDDNMGKTTLARLKHRMDQMDDVISTTANVFLGLTIGCARCHDHKYDPISQQDYYAFLAYFNSSQRKELLLQDFQSNRPKLQPVNAKANAKTPFVMVFTDHGQQPAATHLLWRGNVQNKGPLASASIPQVLRRPEVNAKRQTHERQTHERQSAEMQHRLELAEWISSDKNPLTWRVMANRLWHYHFRRGLVTTPSNFGRLGDRPTHPNLLDWLACELRDGGGRLKEMHRLIVTSAVYRQSSRSTPAGMTVDADNRLWWRMDKRRLEAEPLRDAILSVAGTLNLQTGGPGIKPRIRPDLLVASQRNKWPIVKQEGPEHWRRSVYVYVKRQLQLPILELFDAPSTTHSCARRQESLVPTQALVLMNDEFSRDQANRMAGRVISEAGEATRDQVGRAAWLALSRQPSLTRVEDAVEFVAAQTARLKAEGLSPRDAHRAAVADLCHVLMNLSEFSYVD